MKIGPESRLEIPRSGSNRPCYDHDLRLWSKPAQHIARRHLRAVSHAAYVIDSLMPGVDGKADDDGADEWVENIIAATANEIQAQLDSWRALAVRHAIKRVEGQVEPITVTVEVSSPRLAKYISLTEVLDELSMTADALVTAGLITRGERTDTTRHWREQMAQMGREMIRVAEEHQRRWKTGRQQ